MALFLFTLLLVSSYFGSVIAVYQQVQDYSGSSFFDGWNFNTDHYSSSGFSLYQSEANATNQGLIRTGVNRTYATDAAYMGVDHTNIAPNGRNSVRIESQASFNHALVLADIAHAPGGVCGTWPAFWMLGADPWPLNGEIDIVEGVNDMTTNAMTLHTNAGAAINTTIVSNASISGHIQTSNCDVNAPSQPPNAGCTIKDDSDLSFGAAFNRNGGGVFATEWTSTFIKIWFFPRNDTPADIQSGNPVPSDSWGKPSSLFTGLDIDSHFKDLRLVFNTDFCGSFAGGLFSQSPTCASKGTCNDFVQNNPAAFRKAFWLINYVRVFQDDGQALSNITTTPKRTVRLAVREAHVRRSIGGHGSRHKVMFSPNELS